MATTFEYWSYEYYKTQSEPSLSSAATTLRKNLPQIDRQQLTLFEKELNDIVLCQYADNLSQAFYDNLSTYGGAAFQGEGVVGVTETFAANYSKLGEAWAKYNSWEKELKATGQNLETAVNEKGKTLAQMRKDIYQLRQKLVHITGQMFENLLQTAGPIIANATEQITDEKVKQLINIVENEKKQITTSGSSKGDSVTYTIDSVKNRVSIKGTGKVDVHLEASGVFPEFNISAKSYSNDSRDISLFTGKLLPLMAVWPTSPHNKKYYYNALLRKNPADFLMYTRLILAIQALSGTSKNALADTLVLYNRSDKKHPIRVYSIQELINNILQNDNNVSLERAFPMTLNSLPPTPIEDIDSTLYATQANIVELNAKLNRAYFSINAIEKMKKQRR